MLLLLVGERLASDPLAQRNDLRLIGTEGQLPPVRGFWSLTMYDDKYFFVASPLNRYTLSARNKFTMNPDGSVDLYLQKDNPGGDKEANWLPRE
jgi:hypothetical protein